MQGFLLSAGRSAVSVLLSLQGGASLMDDGLLCLKAASERYETHWLSGSAISGIRQPQRISRRRRAKRMVESGVNAVGGNAPDALLIPELVEELLGALMLRIGEQRFRRALFDDAAVIHKDNPIGHVASEAHLMGDDHHGAFLFRQ